MCNVAHVRQTLKQKSQFCSEKSQFCHKLIHKNFNFALN
jgi:predicted glycoside hydrolase/deacetylase ChbG (UPF0249 family)